MRSSSTGDGSSGGECLDTDALQALVEGRLDERARRAALVHADGCAACHGLVVDAVRAGRDSTSAGEPGPSLGPGSQVDRFVVLGRLGAGGMGIVLLAYDPHLDRKVALKLLRADVLGRGAGPDERARLVREARAMARLSHPAVVTVYEAGVTGEDVFIAMEYVEGGTLTSWLKEAPRPWRAVREVFLKVGTGLAAAHDAEIVHRDFKPENVLVGKDGRVRVTDFGLAGMTPSHGEPESGAASPALDGLTGAGTVLGTPRYMAPEQLAGRPADARADQFAFAVALYEALHGEHPFSLESPQAHADDVRAGRVRAPRNPGAAPGWLRQIALRGLRVDPDARYPSMDALLAALGRDPTARWRRAAYLVAAGVAIASAAVVSVSRPAELCTGAATQLAGVWDGGLRARARAAFLATGKPYAARSFDEVAARLDAYAGGWTAMHEDACRATRVRGEQSPAALDLRMACLGRRRVELRALTTLFARADAEAVVKAIPAVESLEPLDGCADLSQLAAAVPLPDRPATRALVDEVRTVLAAAWALEQAGRYREGLALALPAELAARPLGYRPLQAEAAFRVGRLHELLSDMPAAERSLVAASVAALAGRADEVLEDAEAELVQIGGQEARYPDALRAAEWATAVLERLGPAPRRRAYLDERLGWMLRRRGDYETARARFAEARALQVAARGPEDYLVAEAEFGIGVCESLLGHYRDAVAYKQRALAIAERALGSDNPSIGNILFSLGWSQMTLGDYEAARTLTERALHVWDAALGREHQWPAMALCNLGLIDQARGRYGDAIAALKQATDIQARVAPDEEHTLNCLDALGVTYVLAGKPEAALPLYDRGRAIRARTVEPGRRQWADSDTLLGLIETARGRPDAAVAAFDRARDVYARTIGLDHPEVAPMLNGYGEALVKLGRAADAAPLLEHSLAITTAASGSGHPDRAEPLIALGELDLAAGRKPAAAARCGEAVRLLETAFGPEHPALVRAHTCLSASVAPAKAQPLTARAHRR